MPDTTSEDFRAAIQRGSDAAHARIATELVRLAQTTDGFDDATHIRSLTPQQTRAVVIGLMDAGHWDAAMDFARYVDACWATAADASTTGRVPAAHFDLVYQGGLANLFRDLPGHPSTRVYQGTYHACEYMARGALAAGAALDVWHCDQAGDIACIRSEWHPGTGGPFRSEQHPPAEGWAPKAGAS